MCNMHKNKAFVLCKLFNKSIVWFGVIVERTFKTGLDNIDVATLMKALDECKGNVILLTDEGDRFNLKSKLSQMTGIMKLIEGGIVCNAKISCSDPDDEAMLFRLNLFGKVEDEA